MKHTFGSNRKIITKQLHDHQTYMQLCHWCQENLVYDQKSDNLWLGESEK